MNECKNSCQTMNAKQILQKVNEYGLALVDVTQFLDTHPTDADALNYFNDVREKYKEYHHMFSMQFYPLTVVEAVSTNKFTWVSQPMPWEREANY